MATLKIFTFIQKRQKIYESIFILFLTLCFVYSLLEVWFISTEHGGKFFKRIDKYFNETGVGTSASILGRAQRTRNRNAPVIVVLTYMRSASSLVGDVLQQNPDAFYVFEPLQTVTKALRDGLPFILQNGEAGIFTTEKLEEFSEHVMHSLFTCQVQGIYCSVLLNKLMRAEGKRMEKYTNCLKEENKTSKIKRVCPKPSCLQILKNDCLDSKYVVIKTIRYPMQSMKTFLQQNANIKIIHLIRDPRATLRSEIVAGVGKWKNISTISKTFCQRVANDIEAARIIQNEYPNQIYRLRSEDLSEAPVRVSKLLYKFAGMEYTDDVEHYVRARMLEHEEHPSLKHLKWKGVSTERISRWRATMKWEYINIIDENCRSVYEDVGYKIATDFEMFRNLSVSLLEDRSPIY